MSVAAGRELTPGQRPAAQAAGEVVDHAHRRVGEPELPRHHALRRHGHPDHVGMVGEHADLGRGLEPGPGRLPVHAAVVQRDLGAGAPGVEDAGAPRGVEPGHAVAALVGEGARCRAQRDEVVGQDERADAERRAQRAARVDGEDAVAAEGDERPEIGDVVDEVRRGVPAPAVALQQVRVAEVAHDDGARAVVDGQLRRVGADVAPDQAGAADDGETAHVRSAAKSASAATSASVCARCRSPRSPRP